MLAPPDRWFFQHRFLPFWTPLTWYHRYRLVGAERIPPTGGALILSTHSAATYELFLFIAAVFRESGRIVRPLGHRLWFQIPGLRDFCSRFGAVEATPDAARDLLAQGELVLLAPGGVWEAMRPSSQRHRLRWGERRGFARLALETRSPIHLLACPSADHLFTLYESRLTDWAYRRWQFPLPLLRGLGPTLLPRPVALRGYLSPAIDPPRADESVEQVRTRLTSEMERFLEDAAREG